MALPKEFATHETAPFLIFLPHFLTSSHPSSQVRGAFPQPQLPASSSEGGGGDGGPGRWFSAEEAKAANDEAAEARQRGKVWDMILVWDGKSHV